MKQISTFFKTLIVIILTSSAITTLGQSNGTWSNPLPAGWTKSATVTHQTGSSCAGSTNRLEWGDNAASRGTFIQYQFPSTIVSGSVSYSFTNDFSSGGGGQYDGQIDVQTSPNGSTWTTVQSYGSAQATTGCGGPYTRSLPGGTRFIRWIQIDNDGSDPVALNPVVTFSNITLPVKFGSVSASIKSDALVVNWSTETETNNSYFDIEISKDGTEFHKIGTVVSKAVSGKSDTPLEYSFSATATNLLFSIAFAGLAFITFGFKPGKKYITIFTVAITLLASVGFYSCSKVVQGIDKLDNVFVRIKQTDKDHKAEYSRIVKATVE